MNEPYVTWNEEFSRIDYEGDEVTISNTNLGNLFKLFNLGGIKPEELRSKISEELWMNIEKQETINYVNELYQKALVMYREIFFIDLRKPFNDINFRTSDDIVKFLQKTASWWNLERRQVYCDLTKIMFWFHLIDENPRMKNAEDDTYTLIAENYLKWIDSQVWNFEFNIASIMAPVEWKEYRETEWVYRKRYPSGKIKEIPCKLRFRWKSHEKMLIKILWSEKGNTKITDLVNDSMWLELEPENIGDEIYLFESIYFLFKNLGNVSQTDFRQKPWFFTTDEIKQYISDETLHPDFREFLAESIQTKVKKHGTSKYKDCKWQWDVEIEPWRINWLEARVVSPWNKNQSWLAASEVIDGSKVIDALIWLRGWVSASYIKRISKNVAMKEWIEKDAKTIEEQYISKLTKVQIPWIKHIIYSSPFRLQEIVQNAKSYPDFVVNAIRKHLGSRQSIEKIVEWVKAGTLNIAN